MPETYRVAVYGRTGKGNYGHQLDTAWLDVPQTQIVAVADEQPQGRAAAATRLKVDRTYASYVQMLDDEKPDIIAICPRWVDQHAEIALAAAERGVHIFMEKPFCRSPEEADAIVRACEMRHVKLALAHPTGYSPMMTTLKKLIAEGAIGQVLELRARGKEDRRGGGEDLWVLGSHMLDLILALGYQPQWCFARVLQNGEPVRKEHVVAGNEGLGPLAGDTIHATFGLADGITATFQSQRNAGGNPTRYALQVYGSRGVLDLQEGTLPPAYILQDSAWCPGRTGATWQPITSAGIGVAEPLTDARYKRRNQLAIEDLLHAIEESGEPQCGMYRGRQIVELIAAVFESHRLNAPVTLPLATRVNPLTLLD